LQSSQRNVATLVVVLALLIVAVLFVTSEREQVAVELEDAPDVAAARHEAVVEEPSDSASPGQRASATEPKLTAPPASDRVDPLGAAVLIQVTDVPLPLELSAVVRHIDERGGRSAPGPPQTFSIDAEGEVLVHIDPWPLTYTCELHVSGTGDARTYASGYRRLTRGTVHTLQLFTPPTMSITGRVRSAVSGAPIAGANVTSRFKIHGADAQTNAAGKFSFDYFPAGAVGFLDIVAPGYSREVVEMDTELDQTWVARNWNTPDEQKFAFKPPPAFVEVELLPAAKLRGRTVMLTGEPIAGVDVALEGSFYHVPDSTTPDVAHTRSDSDGRFILEGVRADVAHALTLRASGFATSFNAVAAKTQPEVNFGDITLPEQIEIHGRVVDAEGRSVEGLVVTASLKADPRWIPASLGAGERMPRDPGLDVRPSFEARTAKDGHYQLDGLAAGEYSLSLKAGQRDVKATARTRTTFDPEPVLWRTWTLDKSREIDFALAATELSIHAALELPEGLELTSEAALLVSGGAHAYRHRLSLGASGEFMIPALQAGELAGVRVQAVVPAANGSVWLSESVTVQALRETQRLPLCKAESAELPKLDSVAPGEKP